MPTVTQVSDALSIERPDWTEQQFEDLHAALPDERRTEFQSLLSRFMELGKTVQSAKIAADQLYVESQALQASLGERELAVAGKASELEKRGRELAERDATLSSRERKLDESLLRKESDLLSRERDAEVREANARAGFVKENSAAMEPLRAERAALELHRVKLQAEIENERKGALALMRQELAGLQESLRSQQLDADTREATLEAAAEALALQQRRFQREQRSAEELEAMIQQQADERAADQLQQKDLQVQALQTRIRQRDKDLDGANARLDDFQDMDEQLKGRSPAEVLEELDELRRECRGKDARIAEFELAQSRDDVAALRAERDRLAEELRTLRPELAELKCRDHQLRMGVMEKENWAIEKRLLQNKNQLATSHLNDLESRIRGLTDAQAGQGAFPELGRMDIESVYQLAPPVQPVGDLKSFTEELQHRIAASQPGNPLYFRLEDLQLFMGGLAMSQLHVLQGISGTGKTSLVKAFARVVGGECTDIAVQAGWRDRADLLGHYNAFEKRYYEKDCLQALYKAQTPSFADRLNIILLDEMNLSRPEQYFADFLSGLEKEPGDRRVSLMESAPANPPKSLNQGREIELPENVWFIGTANQDETTNELADKTHDRAFVMELPRHEEHFKVRKDLQDIKYSFASLVKAFGQSQKTDKDAVKEKLQFIDTSELTSVLEDKFGLGWGNRFERQALKFLPVVKAAGGSFETALDHLLATRVFRSGKVIGRYDITKDDLVAIEKALLETWRTSFPGGMPIRCLMAIEKDVKRLERGG